METKVVYKPITKKFMNIADVRVIQVGIKEYVVLKDVFNALGRLTSGGQIETSDRRKLAKIIGGENYIKKFRVETYSGSSRYRHSQHMCCVEIGILQQYDLLSIFGKGNKIIYTNYREEYSFIQLVKDFFRYDKYICIQEQFKIMEFRVDLAIGTNVFVEFDENQHKYSLEEDIERMQKISLANTYSNGYLLNTNNYKEVGYEYKEYEGFCTYCLPGAFFIRVNDKNCLTWIPLMYEHYCEYMDFLDIPPTPYLGNSKDLINLPYLC